MINTHIIRILGGYNCFLLCNKSSGLCTLYQLKRMAFLVKQIKCEQQICEAANQNYTYKLSCGIDVRQDIKKCNKGIVIILYHIVIFFISIFLGGYGV